MTAGFAGPHQHRTPLAGANTEPERSRDERFSGEASGGRGRGVRLSKRGVPIEPSVAAREGEQARAFGPGRLGESTNNQRGHAVEDFEFRLNWGMVIVFTFWLPFAAFLTLNPLSLFILATTAIWLVVLSFIPKLLFFIMLEAAISQGLGIDWFEYFFSRRIRGPDSTRASAHPPANRLVPGFVQLWVVEYASLFGGVDTTARAQVAVAQKRYARGKPSVLQIGRRWVRLPILLFSVARTHAYYVWGYWRRTGLRFVARNVVGKLYVKRPKP